MGGWGCVLLTEAGELTFVVGQVAVHLVVGAGSVPGPAGAGDREREDEHHRGRDHDPIA